MRSPRAVRAAEPPAGEPVGSWPLRPDATSARLARRLVNQAMDEADDNVRRRAALITSELVGNSVRHAHGAMSLALDRLDDGWLVTVADDSSAPPQVHDAAATAEDGRGLLIVARVSKALGWARTPTGKVVWAKFTDHPD